LNKGLICRLVNRALTVAALENRPNDGMHVFLPTR
jgi:hypothetical protein